MNLNCLTRTGLHGGSMSVVVFHRKLEGRGVGRMNADLKTFKANLIDD